MSITRRQFLLTTAGTGIGFIVPSFYDKALAYYENHGEPLLLPNRDADEVIYVRSNRVDGHILNMGDPNAEILPKLTWREFIDEYLNGDESDFLTEDEQGQEIFAYDMEEEVDPAIVMDYTQSFPWEEAYEYLSNLDLGSDLIGPHSVGELRYLSGLDYRAVAATDYITLSLLQERLNQLHTGICIQL